MRWKMRNPASDGGARPNDWPRGYVNIPNMVPAVDLPSGVTGARLSYYAE